MSTENVEVFNRYRGNGAATQFSIGFPYLKREYVKVYLFKGATGEEVKLSNNRFSFVNDSTIKFPVLDTDEILQEGDILTIQRETTLGSEFEFDNQRRLFPVEVMNADDLGFQQIQELRREINRSVRVNPTAEETPEELLSTVYDKLDSATAIAGDAIAAADQATIAAEKATTAVEEAQKQIVETQKYVDGLKEDINTTIDEASMRLSDVIEQAVEDVKQEAINAADETIQATIGASVDEAADYARESKAWARGEDAEVEEFAPGENEHSSRGYADLAMAIANTPEDVPVDASTLLALDVIRGPKGDSGEAEFSGDINFTGTFKVNSDSNHPVSIYGMAGASATGYQIEDTLGAGESDFEHYATGDRYGTRITNHNNKSGTSVNIDLYQSNAGRSVLDTTDVETVLIPTADAGDSSQKAANTEWVNNEIETRTLKTSQITNCITEIPQDIKLELNNGTLTLKAGSKVYVPNGFEADDVTPKFDVVTIASDVVATNSPYNVQTTFFYNVNDKTVVSIYDAQCFSGNTNPTLPSQQSKYYWYDTGSNIIKSKYGSDTSWSNQFSLPLGLAMGSSSSGYTSLNQVFNGFGYIGSTVYALPGIKGLIPNGRNEDGSLRNIEFTTSKVLVVSAPIGTQPIRLEANIIQTGELIYNEIENINIFNSGYRSFAMVGTVTGDSNRAVTSLDIKQPFHAVDRNDSSWVAAQGMPSNKYIDLILGASGSTYTAPANGYFYISKTSGRTNGYLQVANRYANSMTSVSHCNIETDWVFAWIPVKKGDVVVVLYNVTGTTNTFQFIYAEGEK